MDMFKTGAKINLYILLIPVIFFTASFSIYDLLLRINCTSQAWKQYASPNNEWKLIVIKKDCGSLRSLELEGFISKRNEQMNHTDSNLFAFYVMDSTNQLNNLDHLININWDNNSRITVSYDKKLDFLWKEYAVNGIEIQYSKKVDKH